MRSDASLTLLVAHCNFFAAASIRLMMMASMLRSDLMALRLSFSASSRRSSRVRTSRTWSGTGDGFARRDWWLARAQGQFPEVFDLAVRGR